jgi:hypothetical protein
MRIAIVVLAGCSLAGCARGRGDKPGGDVGDDPVDATLSIAPPTSELVIMTNVAGHATFTATLTLGDGTRRDVTAETSFGIDGTYGSFAANDLTMGVAGRTQVFGWYGDKTATADVVARVRSIRVDPSLPPSTVALFDGPPDPALAPQIVYPAPGSVMPRNLGDFEVHWTDAHANSVFEVSLHTEFSDVRIYVPGGNGLPVQGPMASWCAVQASEWLAAVGSQSAVTYQVRGVNPAAPGRVGAAVPGTVLLSNEVMAGGLYYWASASPTNVIGIFRHDMSRPGLPAEEFLTTNETGGRCIACHVLSRDGTRMAITYQDRQTSPGPATMVEVATRAIAPSAASWNFGTFTPDNAQFLAIEHGKLAVRSAATQAVLATMPTTPTSVWVTHPDLSPDGTRLVYVRAALWGTDLDFKAGQIYVRSYDRATYAFGPELPLVSDDQNNFYPSWSPDGNWILFNRSGFGGAYDDHDSAVWAIRSDGSQPPVELASANQAVGITNSWARWAPFPQTLGAGKEPMFWITTSSKRDFGVRLRNTGLAQRARRAQLWMTPFFPRRAGQGKDPSVAAFRLPFQNLDSSNHIAQWTEQVVVIQ